MLKILYYHLSFYNIYACSDTIIVSFPTLLVIGAQVWAGRSEKFLTLFTFLHFFSVVETKNRIDFIPHITASRFTNSRKAIQTITRVRTCSSLVMLAVIFDFGRIKPDLRLEF